MKATLVLECTAYTMDQLMPGKMPLIAVAGRSNVGKSSLINKLAGRKNLAKTSSTPGKTQSLNYYFVEPHGFYLVDLPGYGYAKRSKKEREHWAKMTEAFFTRSPGLRAVMLLIDSRHDPQALDLDLAAYLQNRRIQALPVLTKADKTKQKEQALRRNQWRDIIPGSDPLLVSSQTGVGFSALWSRIFRTMGVEPVGSQPPQA